MAANDWLRKNCQEAVRPKSRTTTQRGDQEVEELAPVRAPQRCLLVAILLALAARPDAWAGPQLVEPAAQRGRRRALDRAARRTAAIVARRGVLRHGCGSRMMKAGVPPPGTRPSARARWSM